MCYLFDIHYYHIYEAIVDPNIARRPITWVGAVGRQALWASISRLTVRSRRTGWTRWTRGTAGSARPRRTLQAQPGDSILNDRNRIRFPVETETNLHAIRNSNTCTNIHSNYLSIRLPNIKKCFTFSSACCFRMLTFLPMSRLVIFRSGSM